jgi:hypothetical protein
VEQATRTREAITPKEQEALVRFAEAHGRNWKSVLTDIYWYNARLWRGERGDDDYVGSVLHGLRNRLGPDWLRQFKL